MTDTLTSPETTLLLNTYRSPGGSLFTVATIPARRLAERGFVTFRYSRRKDRLAGCWVALTTAGLRHLFPERWHLPATACVGEAEVCQASPGGWSNGERFLGDPSWTQIDPIAFWGMYFNWASEDEAARWPGDIKHGHGAD